ncbi:MAG: S8 family serine peptidase [Candidatus Eisenbacteria bacterium]|uniref:S8 family serine peptidase n=1 Tax=Eiseniibacteriota bacterium TaxID=2212470 RepID=A0A933W4A4_UNCEI|nr:S8 family serine peptidase [Candidatus Eisenbacteria bacterium]
MSLRKLLHAVLLACVALALHVSAAWALNAQPIPGEVIVKYRAGVTPARRDQVMSLLSNVQRRREFSFIRAELVKSGGMSTEQMLRVLRSDPNVEYAEPNYRITIDVVPNDPRFSELYGMRNTGQTGGTAGADIRATNAWDVFTGDPNLKVGIIDTGIDYNHPDLAANVWTNPGEIAGNGIDDDGNGYVDDVHGYDVVNNDGDPMDDNGHGSHCAGTIAGVGNNAVGVTGVCWSAKLIGIKFLSASGSGSTEGAIAGIEYAIAVGARLTSNSWGGGGFSQALLDAINAAGTAGQLFIAAAGNSGTDNDASPHYPSTYDSPYIIAVAATDDADALASFSCFGATTVDLGAPGVDILSCQPGGGYQLLSGTSMATPHVSGAAALVWGRFPGATNLQIKQLLLTKADPVPSLAGKCVTGARLNVFLALADPDSIAPGAVSDLAATNPGSTTMGLTWTATGDDAGTGRASRYDIRWSTSPITPANFAAANPVTGPDPLVAGSAESFEVTGLAYNTLYYFALKAADEFGNTGEMSNLASGTTLGAPAFSAAPAALTEALLTGASSNQPLTITNSGAGRLDWTAPTPELLLANGGLVQPDVIYPEVSIAKGEKDTNPGLLGAGGPDSFGYRWVDSDQAGGPGYAWVDITGVGSSLTLTGDDALSAAVPLGFNFPFYGSTFSSVKVCTNGFLTFTDTVTPYSNSALPSASGAQNMLAPFWDDLNFGTTPRVYTYNDGTRFIVSFVAVPRYSAGGPYTFQVLLYPSGEIRYQYQTMAAPLDGATVGIQNATETVGLTTAYNVAYLHDALAIRYIPLRQWLSVSPTSGQLASGASQNVNVHFDATGLMGGTYLGNVLFSTNAPAPLSSVPATLTVTGAPNVAATPDTSNFGTHYANGTYALTLNVANDGTDALHVTGIASSDPSLTAAPASFTVAPSSTVAVTLSWHPVAPSTLDATVTIASDDPDSPSLVRRAIGSAVAAPAFSVNPNSFDVTLNTNTATSQNLRVTNGGGSALTFAAATVVNAAPQPLPARDPQEDLPYLTPKGQPDQVFGVTPESAGGPDAFGYRWADSNEPGGPAFSWVEISGTGTAIALTGDDVNTGPLPIGFNFPFYGTTFPTFRICTNGWLSFTSALTAFSNTALPNAGTSVPENLVAPFWDDLNFTGGAQAFYQYDGSRLIVEWKNVPRYLDTTHPNTFEVILYPDGRIVYQYLSMTAATMNSNTVGIQNAARNDGLAAAFNTAYVANNLAVRFTPPARWLTVTPLSGSIPAGGFLDLTVGFNAAGMSGGTYSGAVRLNTNDPTVPQFDVASTLHVIGVPDIAVTPGALAFDTAFVNVPRNRQLTVQNTGSDALLIDEVTIDNASYTSTGGAVTIPPGGSSIVTVTINPNAIGTHPGTLTIKSNDPDTPFLAVPLTGEAVGAPDYSASHTVIEHTVFAGDADEQAFVVHNSGFSNLYWSLATAVSTALGTNPTVYHTPGLAKDVIDGRPGILGSGGPDAYGYRWKDSDAAGGPAFGWVDITATGTHATVAEADDATATAVPIGFAFPFYGSTFSTVNICSNGWLSFTSALTSYSNAALPNTGSGVPENLVAPFWDDLDLSTTGSVLYQNDGSRFIVSWVAAPHFSSGGPYTFQAILYPSGKIVFQYLTVGTSVINSQTIGIQDAARTVGLNTVYNANYVHDGLAIEYSRMPDWLSVSPPSGTAVVFGANTGRIGFDATELAPGTYTGTLTVTTNDPDEGLVNVPVTLHVITGYADAGTPLPKAFGLRLAGANPVRGRAGIELALPTAGSAHVGLYDVRGALVRTLASGPHAAGTHRLALDGSGAAGEALPSGVYFVKARTAGGEFRQRVVILH